MHRLARSTALALVLTALATPAGAQDLRKYQDLRSPDIRDMADGRTDVTPPPVRIVHVSQPASPTPDSDGTVWATGKGALAVLITLVLGAGLTALVARHRTVRQAPGSPV